MFGKFRTISFIFFTGILLRCNAEELGEDYETVLEETSKLLANADDFDMETAIQNIESLALIAEQMTKVHHLLPATDIDNFYDHMIQAVYRIQSVMRHSDNVYKFMKANGVLRILSNNLMNTHSELRTTLLLLLKDIFDTTPIAANTLLPINIVDRLIEIFEHDTNLAIKAHALDILYKWLPNNPQAQVRVMKISGLETFYNQIDKLDIGVVQTLMELFNTILKEHLDVKNDKEQVAKDDGEKIKTYQTIGILERMSTPKVCNGLLNIIEMLWSYNKNESDTINIVLELITNVKPFCLTFYKKKAKATDLFEALLKYVENEERKEYFEKLGVNVTDVMSVIEEYLFKEKHAVNVKDEF